MTWWRIDVVIPVSSCANDYCLKSWASIQKCFLDILVDCLGHALIGGGRGPFSKVCLHVHSTVYTAVRGVPADTYVVERGEPEQKVLELLNLHLYRERKGMIGRYPEHHALYLCDWCC